MKKIIEEAQEEYALKIEGAIRVCLKPRPKYIPEKVWLRLASKFIVLEEVSPKVSLAKQNIKGV